jgi:predicted nucleotidyltransferase
MNARQTALNQLCDRFRVDGLYVFGSRAGEVKAWFDTPSQGLAESASDVDIGVKPSASVHFDVDQKVLLALSLEDLLEVPRVDLVSLDEADPFVAANIIRGERLFARDDYLADEYDLYILRRAGDLIPLERERMALILGEEI